jgi:transposase
MRKLREVLRLSYSAGLSIRKISASTKISVGSIQNILKLAEQLNLSWPLPDGLDDQALALKFYPRSDAKPSAKYQEPVWIEVHQELKKKGLTKQLLWDDCMDAGGRATQEQLPKNIPSTIRTVAIVTRSFAPAMQTG